MKLTKRVEKIRRKIVRIIIEFDLEMDSTYEKTGLSSKGKRFARILAEMIEKDYVQRDEIEVDERKIFNVIANYKLQGSYIMPKNTDDLYVSGYDKEQLTLAISKADIIKIKEKR